MNSSTRHRIGAGGLLAASIALAGTALAATESTSRDRFVELFTPFQTEIAALAPDGRHLAYSLREGDTLSVIVIDTQHPEVATAKVAVVTDRAATPTLDLNSAERTPAQIRWMGWATENRLVIETNQVFANYDGTRWNNVSGAIVAFDADGGNARTLVTPADVAALPSVNHIALGGSTRTDRATNPDGTFATPGAAANAGTQDPGALRQRSPFVFDFAPDDPDALLVIASDPPDYTLYRLDIRTGRLRSVREEVGDPNMLPLLDRQGKLRAGVPNSTRLSFPHRFALQNNSFGARWRDLDRIAGQPQERHFVISPENYFGERAVPLGFDENPDLLYFASNVGRDTFGIYGLNVKTGARTDVAIEHPDIDLYQPARGVFPDAGTFIAFDEEPDAPAEEAPDALGGEADEGDEAEATAAAAIVPTTTAVRIAPARPPGRNHNPGATLVFDRFTRQLAGVRFESARRTARWLRPEWQEVQTALEKLLPGRNVELREWDRDRERFLVFVHGTGDPGRFCIFDRRAKQLAEFVQRAPRSDAGTMHPTVEFSFAHPAGGVITGRVTVPPNPRLNPIPMVVFCPPMPWERWHADYSVEAQAIAEMGFVAVQFNGRGAWGFGVKQRTALQSGWEETQVEDILITVEQLGHAFQVNPQRVALLGERHGGFVALRALQLHPDRFRSAIAINAPVDLKRWLNETRWSTREAGPALAQAFLGDKAHLDAAPLVRQPGLITKPVFVLSYRGLSSAETNPGFVSAQSLVRAVRRPEVPAEFLELEADFMADRPQAKAAVFRRIEEFFNLTIYDYAVELGPEKVVEETP